MKDLTEAELIEMERKADALEEMLSADPERLRTRQLIDRFESAFYQAQTVAADVTDLCEHLRAVSIEAQKMENLAARDTA